MDLQEDYKGMSDRDIAEKLKQEHEVQQVSDYKIPTEIID